ncbi:type I methionyl aminopeptidase [Propionispora vibrioides]|uniref:Methionine aminopeptidase n=1 Tax=Propionispora vibrioides TaxID=112903 RepID=A0A1H8XRX4_9FIRM|nr:type I methionyl aminopeptidase [Propionispora vibrioides]SEP42483.1 methionyl aminopeptidase [Propionispora vibrioides]
MLTRLGKNDACWCGSQKEYRKCHADFDEKVDHYKRQGHLVPSRQMIRNPLQIAAIRESGKVNAAVLDAVTEYVKEGITTEEIDRLIYQKTIELGGIPAQLGYKRFPKSVCTSLNNQVCHGIPSPKTVLCDGDIINVDVSTIYKDYFSDSSRMFCVGNVTKEARRLVRVGQECVILGLRQVRPWGFLGDLGQVIQEHAVKHGYSVVKKIGGHGIGLRFHEPPWIGYEGKANTGMLLAPGMIFTIEPIINAGKASIYLAKNGWTYYTEDDSLSVQWEVMVLVTEDGYEVLAY